MVRTNVIVKSWHNVSRGLAKIMLAMTKDTAGIIDNVGYSNSEATYKAETNSTKKNFFYERPTFLSGEDVTNLRKYEADRREKNDIVHRSVPSTRVSRAAGFASLFVQLGWDKLSGYYTSSSNRDPSGEGGLFSTHSHERIVDALCRMRGAVLKLGQMLSIQDAATVPSHVTRLFERVRDSAYAMPLGQLNHTLEKEYGNANWRTDLFVEFCDKPIAAASIGQVHRAAVRGAGGAGEVERVAVKVQYPGVARSIDSDVANLKLLISLNLLPSGMFADKILQELREELALECRYTLEAEKQMRYAGLVEGDARLREVFVVPKVYKSLSTDHVLVSQLVSGVPVDSLATLPDKLDLKNYVVQHMFLLTLLELFSWRFMQTDPNFSNFLFDEKTNRISLLDFGAAREYSEEFVRDYLDVVIAAARQDVDTIISKSIALGFLTGNEMKAMLDAHVASVLLLGKPFRHSDKAFDFAAENIPAQIQKHVPTIVQLRLRPPPTQVYSLHRRLSGTILLATKLKASVNTGEIFWNICGKLQV